jgi:hypothetical protein
LCHGPHSSFCEVRLTNDYQIWLPALITRQNILVIW